MRHSNFQPSADAGLLDRVVGILDAARTRAVRHVNSEMVLAYWLIGQEIVQALQGGQDRADYGTALLDSLSKGLQQRYGRGFSVSNIKYFRQFYQVYAHRQPVIRHEARGELAQGDGPALLADLSLALAERDEVVARYSVLNEGKQLFASRYMTVLPSEEELRAEIEREAGQLRQD
jgi:DUF1016 N-terminal domain